MSGPGSQHRQAEVVQLSQMDICADCAGLERLEQILGLRYDNGLVAQALERPVLGGANPPFLGGTVPPGEELGGTCPTVNCGRAQFQKGMTGSERYPGGVERW